MADQKDEMSGVPTVAKVLVLAAFAMLFGLGAIGVRPGKAASTAPIPNYKLPAGFRLANELPLAVFPPSPEELLRNRRVIITYLPSEPQFASPAFLSPRLQTIYQRSCGSLAALWCFEPGDEPWAPHHLMFDALAMAGLGVGFRSVRNARDERARQRASI
jgi:hypothetical protein